MSAQKKGPANKCIRDFSVGCKNDGSIFWRGFACTQQKSYNNSVAHCCYTGGHRMTVETLEERLHFAIKLGDGIFWGAFPRSRQSSKIVEFVEVCALNFF